MTTIETRFRNRSEAGKLLASRLTQYANRSDVLVLGIPHGGVTVACEVATALNAPLDTCERLRTEVDEVVCLMTPEQFCGIGLWYEDFAPTTDEQVCELLNVVTRQA